jgi:hypothetical protein
MDSNGNIGAANGAAPDRPTGGRDPYRWPAAALGAGAFSHEASDAFGAIGYEAADPSLQERLWQAAIPDLRRLWQRP